MFQGLEDLSVTGAWDVACFWNIIPAKEGTRDIESRDPFIYCVDVNETWVIFEEYTYSLFIFVRIVID